MHNCQLCSPRLNEELCTFNEAFSIMLDRKLIVTMHIWELSYAKIQNNAVTMQVWLPLNDEDLRMNWI